MHIVSQTSTGEEVSYKPKNSHFSGFIFFTSLEGNYINGWQYENGIIIRRSSKRNTAGSSAAKLLPPEEGEEECTTYETRWYKRQCYEYYNGDYKCEEWVYIGSTYETYCTSTGGGGGGVVEEPEGKEPSQEQLDREWLNKIEDSTNNPCASSVILNLKSLGQVLPDLFRNIFDTSATINITFKAASLGPGKGAETVQNYTSNNFSITINTYYQNQTSLSGAATILHELVHAQLMDWYRQAVRNNDLATQTYLATEYYLYFDSASISKYPDLNFTTLMNQNQGGQHQIITMGNIRQQISDALLAFAKNVDPNTTVDALYCDSMAWAGTSDAEGFKTLPESEQNRINNIIEGERGNNDDPYFVQKGNPCP